MFWCRSGQDNASSLDQTKGTCTYDGLELFITNPGTAWYWSWKVAQSVLVTPVNAILEISQLWLARSSTRAWYARWYWSAQGLKHLADMSLCLETLGLLLLSWNYNPGSAMLQELAIYPATHYVAGRPSSCQCDDNTCDWPTVQGIRLYVSHYLQFLHIQDLLYATGMTLLPHETHLFKWLPNHYNIYAWNHGWAAMVIFKPKIFWSRVEHLIIHSKTKITMKWSTRKRKLLILLLAKKVGATPNFIFWPYYLQIQIWLILLYHFKLM